MSRFLNIVLTLFIYPNPLVLNNPNRVWYHGWKLKPKLPPPARASNRDMVAAPLNIVFFRSDILRGGGSDFFFQFFKKYIFKGTPFFQICFLQNCLAHPHAKFHPDRTSSFWEKWFFLKIFDSSKNDGFWTKSSKLSQLAPWGLR